MEKKVLFVYEFEGRTKGEVNKVNRELFGYIDHSKHGKYVYKREGQLSKFHIEKILKGAFITDECNDKEILKILHSKGTKKIKRFYLDVTKIVG
jgi:DeoR/GlpR family transcriptional regulator of sugar metabolism